MKNLCHAETLTEQKQTVTCNPCTHLSVTVHDFTVYIACHIGKQHVVMNN